MPWSGRDNSGCYPISKGAGDEKSRADDLGLSAWEMHFMYAVVETGGKQVRLEQGDSVKVERIDGEVGEAIELDDVRLIVDGENVVADKGALDASKVKAVIRGHGRGDKVYAFRYKKRKNIRTKRGHRQYYTEIEVTDILKGSN